MSETATRGSSPLPEGPFAAHAALLLALPTPCAALDGALRVSFANPAFQALVGRSEVVGRPLGELLQLDDAVVPGREQRIRARLSSGEPVTVLLSGGAGVLAAVVEHRKRDEAQDRVQQALLALSRDVVSATGEEELVAGVARAVRELFPRAFHCIRVVDPRTFSLTSLYAEGRLRDAARKVLCISRSAADKLGLDQAELAPDRVQVVEEPPLVFTGTARGLCTPLVASGQLFGALNLEFPPGDARDLRADERTVIRVANQVAVGLRNAKLFDEVNYVKRYLEQLIEHANALIVVVNREKRIIVFNRAMARLSAYSREQVLGRDFGELIPAGELKRVQRLVAKSLRGDQASNFETAIRRKDGQAIRVAFSTATVRSAAGEVEGVIGVGQDLTQLKELERQVLQAEKLASLGQLAAGVAHEINNPLTTISIYADQLVRKLEHEAQGDSQDVEKLRRIVEAADRILKLARDLTSYARPAHDQPEPLSINEVLDQVVTFCDHVVKEREVQVFKRYGEGLERVPAVKANLIQVFVNLLTNACHATEPGGSVELVTCPSGKGIEVRLKDTGCGIPSDHLGKIFEPFFTTKEEGRGTGLGLSIVQGIVAKHGGTVDVTSRVGVGTTFVVRLPGADEPSDGPSE